VDATWSFQTDRRQSFPYRAMRRSTPRLDTDSVVDGRPDSLLATQVSLGGLDRDVTEKKLERAQLHLTIHREHS
jgi:hypothetical protein